VRLEKLSYWVLLFLLAGLQVAVAEEAPETPYLNKTDDACMGWSTDGWRIARRSPSNYEFDNGEKDEVVDFTVFQAADGTWQIIGCVRWATCPVPYDTKGQGKGRLLFRWESADLLAPDWKEMGVLLTTEDMQGVDKYAGGLLQAPYVVKDGDLYYMICNTKTAHLLVSQDGKNWTQQKNHAGSYELFDTKGGRDITLVDNRDVDGKWYAVLCQKTKFKAGFPGYVQYTSATNLLGPWSELTEMATQEYWQDVESPSVVRRGGWYYLFLQDQIFAQPNITDYFDRPIHADLNFFVGQSSGSSVLRGIAPEIIHHKGQDYIATYNTMEGKPWEGIELRPLHWKPTSADCSVPATSSPE
jgi:hypothetical protein